MRGCCPTRPRRPPVGREGTLDAEVENLRAATDWLIRHADPARLDTHLVRLWPWYRRRGWFREAQAVLTAALEHAGVPVTEQARWHRLLGEAHMELGEVRPARQHFERTLALLGSSMPASTLGWLDVLTSQALQRRLRRLRPGGVGERGEERRIRAGERAATCWQMAEACYVLEDWSALLPLALFGLNQAERAGRPDLTARTQIGVGMITGIVGLRRLGRRQVRAAVSAADRAGDPVTICWTQQVGGLYWLGVGDWTMLDTRAPTALAAGAAARLHRLADIVVLISALCRYLTGRFDEAAAMATQATAAGRDRHDPTVQLWGLLVLMESRLRVDASDPAIAEWLEHRYAPVEDRRTKDRLTDGQRAFNRMQAGLRALVEQAIGHLANAWALRRWRGLLHRLRDVFRAAGALVCLGRWLHRVPT
jgi:hypothetical protein